MYCWVTTGDGSVHTADTTQLDFVVGKLFRLVETVANLRIQYTPPTQLNSTVKLRTSASAVRIGLQCVLQRCL